VKYQEIEAPPIAREVLESMYIEPEPLDHVCRIIAGHHSAGDIDTPEFRIAGTPTGRRTSPKSSTPPARGECRS